MQALLAQPGFKASLIGDPANDPDGANPAVPALEPFLASLQYGGSLRGLLPGLALTLTLNRTPTSTAWGLLPGLHVMHVPVKMTYVETLTGLGAAGCHAVLVCHPPGRTPGPAHPFIPTLQVAAEAHEGATASSHTMDAVFSEEPLLTPPTHPQPPFLPCAKPRPVMRRGCLPGRSRRGCWAILRGCCPATSRQSPTAKATLTSRSAGGTPALASSGVRPAAAGALVLYISHARTAHDTTPFSMALQNVLPVNMQDPPM